MKKNLFKVLFGVLVFFVGVNVHAVKTPESGGEIVTDPLNGGTTGSVVVGEVATPVYEVNIFWEDLTFDWTYDYDTNSFGWKPASLCERDYEMVGYEAEFDEKLASGEIYTDATCSTVTHERTEEAIYYAVRERDYVYMGIEDFSQNGQIVPSISWNAESNYSYTIANFEVRDEKCIAVARVDVYNAAKEYGTGLYADATCSTKATDTGYETGKYYAVARTGYSKLNTTEIPDSVRESGAGSGAYIEDLGLQIGKPAFAENQYAVRFNLGITAQPETTPTAGNKIGTITVSFRAK